MPSRRLGAVLLAGIFHGGLAALALLRCVALGVVLEDRPIGGAACRQIRSGDLPRLGSIDLGEQRAAGVAGDRLDRPGSRPTAEPVQCQNRLFRIAGHHSGPRSSRQMIIGSNSGLYHRRTA